LAGITTLYTLQLRGDYQMTADLRKEPRRDDDKMFFKFSTVIQLIVYAVLITSAFVSVGILIPDLSRKAECNIKDIKELQKDSAVNQSQHTEILRRLEEIKRYIERK
jgi:hypothetical protein